MWFRPKFYSLPEIPRSEGTLAHIARYYDGIADLMEHPPDGVIVTGAEPRAKDLRDEPYWKSLSGLARWTQANGIPSVWCCLAAHAAVLQMDGIDCSPLGRKLSGIFECDANSTEHNVFYGMPEKWRVPHSRIYGLSDDALVAKGYNILSWSSATGANVFIKEAAAPAVFFQGHPEYCSRALQVEYQSNVGRFLGGVRDTYPDLPVDYFEPHIEAELLEFRERAIAKRSPALLDELTGLMNGPTLTAPWFAATQQIYTNWLLLVSDQRLQSAAMSMHPLFETELLRRLE